MNLQHLPIDSENDSWHIAWWENREVSFPEEYSYCLEVEERRAIRIKRDSIRITCESPKQIVVNVRLCRRKSSVPILSFHVESCGTLEVGRGATPDEDFIWIPADDAFIITIDPGLGSVNTSGRFTFEIR